MSSFTLYEDYTPPSWSMRPKLPFYLEILKNGVPFGDKKIDNKAMYLIGKNNNICDIVLDNPTISRKHAVLQSKITNEFFVYDLGSTHGTFVNNIQIPTKLFHKLKPFDQIRFGQSQRVYILRCSELEKEDANVQEQELQKKLDKKNAKREFKTLKEHYLNVLYQNPQYRHMKPRKKEEQEIDGIDWGIDDEQEVYRYQQEQDYPLEPELLLQLPGLSEQVIDKINKYGEKLGTYRSQLGELDDILAKERKNFGLDEVKERNKSDLEGKVQEIGSELESLEVGLKFVLFGDRVSKVNKFEQTAEISSEEEDEYYDLTKQQKTQQQVQQEKPNQEIKVERTTESYQQLKKRLESLIEERDHLNMELLNIKNNEEQQIDEEDELDNYMKQTAISIAQEERPKLLETLKKILNEIDVVSNQLKYVKPDIKLAFFEDEDEDEEEEVKQIKEQQQEQQQREQHERISTMEKLKKLQEQAEKEEEEEDEEKILEKARKHFEKEAEKESYKEKSKVKQQKEQQKVQEILKQYDEQEAEQIQQQLKMAPKAKPHPRHYRDSEVGATEFVDITKFQ